MSGQEKFCTFFPSWNEHLFNEILLHETPLVLLRCSVNEITELMEKITILRLGHTNL